jgi:hypothetical protein
LLSLKVLIGILINIIVYPFIIFLVELFKRPRRYVERKEKIDKVLKNIEKENNKYVQDKACAYNEIKTKIKRIRFPWWIKIISYLISHSLMIISATLVIIKGIDFGDQICGKWLTSLIFAFLSSAFLTQPLQVFKLFLLQRMAFLFMNLFFLGFSNHYHFYIHFSQIK